MPPVRPILVASGAGIGVAAALTGMAFWATGPRGGGDWVWSLCVAVIYGPAGVVLASRAPRLAGVLAAMGLSAGIALLAGESAEAAASGGTQVLGEVTVWLSSWTWVPAYALLLGVMPHVLPDGTLPGRLSRWGYRVGISALGVSTIAWMLCPYDELDEASSAALALGADNPFGVPGMASGVAIGLVLVLAAAAAGVPSLVLRWRSTEDRTTLSWALGGFGLTSGFLLAGLGSDRSWAWVAAAALLLPGSLLLGAASRSAALDSELTETRARLALAREEERRRLRHDLHDSLGPALAGVALQLEAMPADIQTAPARATETAERLTARIQAAVDEVRRLVEGLGPDGSLGLAEGLREQVAAFDTAGRRTTLTMTPGDLDDLPAAVESAALRVVGESLANMARHSGSDRCEVTVARCANELLVTVRDHGCGVDAARGSGSAGTGVGLLSMRAVTQEIGGTCTVADADGGGTEVRVELPVRGA